MKKLIAAATMIVLLGACSSDETDYRDAAKKAIGGKDAETQLGQKFDDITCATPASKDVGTTFACTATGASDGAAFIFTAEIKSKKLVEIVDVQPG